MLNPAQKYQKSVLLSPRAVAVYNHQNFCRLDYQCAFMSLSFLKLDRVSVDK